MQDNQQPGVPGYLSRTDVEIELARLALAVMRAAPGAFDDLGVAPAADDAPAAIAARLLARTRPEHRPFVEGRLRELSRSLAGMHGEAAPVLALDPAESGWTSPSASRSSSSG